MPAAPRPKGKPSKIAREVLGVPENQMNKQNAHDKRIEQLLRSNETRLGR